MARFTAVLVALWLTACAGSDVRPKTINDVARAWCAAFFAQQMGVSIDDAARAICVIPEVLAPFLKATQDGNQNAGADAMRAAELAGVVKKSK